MSRKALASSGTSAKELVDAFNALPRRQKAPSGKIPNEWYFDMRYVQIEPTPSHIVHFVQPHSQYTHMERLPLGLATSESGLAFFPDTAEEAAPMVAEAILHAFVNKLGAARMPIPDKTPAFAPWKLMTSDKALALAVGQELKRIGVKAESLWTVSLSKAATNAIAHSSFKSIFQGLKRIMGIEDWISALIKTPETIGFEKIVISPRSSYSYLENPSNDEERFDALLIEYINLKSRIIPQDGSEYNPHTLGENMIRDMAILRQEVIDKPESVLETVADRGDAQAALDYGLRLTIGLGCTSNRKRAHDYFIKAAYSPSASSKVKAMAHGQLIVWCIEANTEEVFQHYFFAAAHHCNVAARYCKEVSPSGVPASPIVLWYMHRTFYRFTTSFPELNYWYKDAIKAHEFRMKQMEAGKNKMIKKRLKRPNRYRCAAPGCGVQADTGSMMSKCGGSCDPNKKPFYCSKSCQKADWKNHKEFCRPGAECSVIDDGSYDPVETAPSSQFGSGALQIPVTFADGKKIIFSSSTMDAEMLKEIQRQAQGERTPTHGLDRLEIGHV